MPNFLTDSLVVRFAYINFHISPFDPDLSLKASLIHNHALYISGSVPQCQEGPFVVA